MLRKGLSRQRRVPVPFKMAPPFTSRPQGTAHSERLGPSPAACRIQPSPARPGPALRRGVLSREPGCGAQLRAVMVAPMYGSPGGRLARAVTRALALALVLALLVGLFLSGLTGAIPTPRGQRGRGMPVPPASRCRSLLLDPETGQLSLVDGRHPDAVAWANLTNAIRETG